MDIVVGLALVVLVAVFLFSLFMIIVTCNRRKQYNRLIESQSQQQTMRFAKLRQENLDDVVQLVPHISQTLDRNQWVEELATDLLQHCVAVLKLCHSMTEQMAQSPLDQKQCPPELNQMICRATARVMPRFEALLRSMAAKDVDIRVIEARVGALVSACWALTAPFALANPSQRDKLEELTRQMDNHMMALQSALDQFEEEQQKEHHQQMEMANNSLTPSTSASAHQLQSQQQNHIHTSTNRRDSDKEPEEKQPERNVTRTTGNGAVTLRIEPDDQANSSLLTDETAPPADPAIT